MFIKAQLSFVFRSFCFQRTPKFQFLHFLGSPLTFTHICIFWWQLLNFSEGFWIPVSHIIQIFLSVGSCPLGFRKFYSSKRVSIHFENYCGKSMFCASTSLILATKTCGFYFKRFVFVLVSFRTSSSIVIFTFSSFSSSMSMNFLVSGILRSNAVAGDGKRKKKLDLHSFPLLKFTIKQDSFVQKVNSPQRLVVPLSTSLFFANSQNLFS